MTLPVVFGPEMSVYISLMNCNAFHRRGRRKGKKKKKIFLN